MRGFGTIATSERLHTTVNAQLASVRELGHRLRDSPRPRCLVSQSDPGKRGHMKLNRSIYISLRSLNATKQGRGSNPSPWSHAHAGRSSGPRLSLVVLQYQSLFPLASSLWKLILSPSIHLCITHPSPPQLVGRWWLRRGCSGTARIGFVSV